MPEPDPRFSHYREVLVYSRWSSKVQTSGQSRTRQQDLASDWAKAHGVTLSNRRLVDAGASGFHGKNLESGGALGQLLAEVKEGKVPTPALLLVEAADRFGRRPPMETLQRIFGQCLELGLDLLLLGRDLHVTKAAVNSDVSVLIRLALEIDAAHRYSDQLSRRMLQAHEQGRKAQSEGRIARAGWRPEWVDLVDTKGQVIPRTAPRELVKNGVKWELNDLAATVERVIAMAEQGMGQTLICKTFNSEGIPPLRGERTYANALAKAQEEARKKKEKFDPASVPRPSCNPGQVEHLLQSPAVAGGRELKRRTGDITWDYYPPVITRARWEALRQLLNGKATGSGSGKQDQIRFIGQAVTTCSSCGGSMGFRMTNHSKNGKLYPVSFLRCRGRVRGTCAAPMLRMDPVVAHVLTRLSADQLAQLFPAQGDDTGRAMLLKCAGELRQQHREAKALAAAAEAEIQKALASEPALAAVLGRQVVAGEQRATELEKQLLAAEHQLEECDRDRQQGEVTALEESASELLQTFARQEDVIEQRRTVNALLRRLHLRIVVDAAAEQIGMAVADGPAQWQPLAPKARGMALAAGLVNPPAAWDHAGIGSAVVEVDGTITFEQDHGQPPADAAALGYEQGLADALALRGEGAAGR